jgi:hypothetical protein
LPTAVDVISREVAGLAREASDTGVALHNSRTGVRPINFTVGDFALRGVLTREKGRKLLFAGKLLSV